MRDNRTRAFWMTWLFYALAGPLVGLLCLLLISFVIEAWGPIADRLSALVPHTQNPACDPSNARHIDLRCFQRFEPRQFRFPLGFDSGMLSLFVFGAYVVGFIPASLAGLVIAVGRLRDDRVGFFYAFLVGAVIGFLTGSLALFYPQNAIALFFICLIATIVCWFITARWWRKAALAEANSAGQAKLAK
jgi:hypothetical protein